MPIRKTVQLGNPVIRARAKIVANVSAPRIRKIITDLTDSMRNANLVGMAAPQIGKGLRIFVSEIQKTKFRKHTSELDHLRVFINPRILSHSKTHVRGYEGCGSVASSMLFGEVSRPRSVVVRAWDVRGKPFRLEASGLLARIIQHEIDHLNGIVFLDRMRNMKKLLGREEFISIQDKK